MKVTMATSEHTHNLAINLTNVAKIYRGRVHALRGIALSVNRGEIFGLLGPNGAGKSTLVKILMSVIHPTRCEGTMLGTRVGDKAVLARVGYLPEHHRFPEYLTGTQVVDYFGAMAGMPRRERAARIPELLELVGMRDWATRRVRQYSKGMRQRIGIAQALIHNPDLVVLDEPTDGVDPVGRRDIRVLMMKLKEQGKTVFVNSHLLSELEMVCDRVAILVQGKVFSQGTIDELTKSQQRYEIELMGDPARLTGEPASAIAAAAAGLSPTLEPKPDGVLLHLATADAATIQSVIDALRRASLTIRAIRPIRPSLEDLFMQAVTDPNTGQAFAPGAAREGAKR